MQSELNLAQARLSVLQELADFASEGTNGGLTQQVAELRSTVPDAQASEAATTQPTPAATNQTLVQISSLGILGLIEEMFTLSHKMSEVKQLAGRTELVQKQLEQLRAPITAALMDAIHRADALAAQHDSNDPKVLAAQQQQVDALTGRFSMLSKPAVPLREASTTWTLRTARSRSGTMSSNRNTSARFARC